MIPKYVTALCQSVAPAMADHLWQSTLFALAVAIVIFLLRKHQARIRYHLWLAASVKFLIPFSLLISLGSRLASSREQAGVPTIFYFAIQKASQPFTPAGRLLTATAHTANHPSSASLLPILISLLTLIWLGGCISILFHWWARWRRLALSVHSAVELHQGREVDALRQLEIVAGGRRPIPLVLSHDAMEPGVFGVVRQILLWPAGISVHLDDRHLKAILAHELWHVRRRDNLAAAMHMAVEAIFWFHPLVWWLGARLVEERERACDEEVLLLGNSPQSYAESILRTCEFCVESPLACVSGVTGANLKSRIVRIMSPDVALKLDATHKSLLIAVSVIAITAPILFGQVNSTKNAVDSPAKTSAVPLPAFEVASIKPNHSAGNGPVMLRFTPDGFMATNMPLKMLMREAFSVEENQILGAPAWLGSHSYDIEAKVDSAAAGDLRNLNIEQRKVMIQPLLADRFKLKFHRESKVLPIYELVAIKGGTTLHKAKPGDTYADGIKGPDGNGGPGLVWIEAGQLTCQGIPIADLTRLLSERLGHNVIDKTGLTGTYDIKMQWPENDAPAAAPPGPAASDQGGGEAPPPTGPSIFTALKEQLGLRLESRKAPVEVLVIDHIEPPSEN